MTLIESEPLKLRTILISALDYYIILHLVSCLKRKQYIKKKRKKPLIHRLLFKFSQYHVAFSRSQDNLYHSSKVVSLKKVFSWVLFCFFSLSSEQWSSGGKYHYLSTNNAKTLVKSKIQGKYK